MAASVRSATSAVFVQLRVAAPCASSDCENSRQAWPWHPLRRGRRRDERNTLTDIADVAILSYNAAGCCSPAYDLRAGNNGIQIIRRETGDDGTMVVDNRIETIATAPAVPASTAMPSTRFGPPT